MFPPLPKPLRLVRSNPPNGAAGVSIQLRTILLVFDQNVVSDNVWNRNKCQIEMYHGPNRVAINVARVPDTVDYNQCRNIYVKPLRPLLPWTRYQVVICPELESKFGDILEKTVTLTFKTGRRPPEAEE